jgi:hypothetical protein
MATFGMLQGRRSYLIYGNLISIVGSIISTSRYGYGQMIAWRVLVGLGNGITTSTGPVLYSDVVYQGLEFGVILTSKFRAPLRCGASKNIICGDAGISIAGSATDRGIFLVYAGLHLFEDNPRPGARDIYKSTPG